MLMGNMSATVDLIHVLWMVNVTSQHDVAANADNV